MWCNKFANIFQLKYKIIFWYNKNNNKTLIPKLLTSTINSQETNHNLLNIFLSLIFSYSKLHAILSPLANKSLLGHIYEDIRSYFDGLHSAPISWVRRGRNTVAHSLAQYAKNILDEMYWLEDWPPPAMVALYQDSLHLNEWMNSSLKKKKIHFLTFFNNKIFLFILILF